MINLDRKKAALLIIDIQERLALGMEKGEFDSMFKNTKTLIQGCHALNLPIIQSLQYKKGLGESVAGLFDGVEKMDFEKRVFSCCYENSEFMDFLRANKHISQVIIAGMEAHVCVLQTARDLILGGFEVVVASDCVISRKNSNKQNALRFTQSSGGNVLNYESILFDLLKTSSADEFKTISNLVK